MPSEESPNHGLPLRSGDQLLCGPVVLCPCASEQLRNGPGARSPADPVSSRSIDVASAVAP